MATAPPLAVADRLLGSCASSVACRQLPGQGPALTQTQAPSCCVARLAGWPAGSQLLHGSACWHMLPAAQLEQLPFSLSGGMRLFARWPDSVASLLPHAPQPKTPPPQATAAPQRLAAGAPCALLPHHHRRHSVSPAAQLRLAQLFLHSRAGPGGQRQRHRGHLAGALGCCAAAPHRRGCEPAAAHEIAELPPALTWTEHGGVASLPPVPSPCLKRRDLSSSPAEAPASLEYWAEPGTRPRWTLRTRLQLQPCTHHTRQLPYHTRTPSDPLQACLRTGWPPACRTPHCCMPQVPFTSFLAGARAWQSCG